MKTFKQFQEQIKTGGTIKKPTVIMPDGKELPGLGGGGGGTNSITDKSPAKSFKKRVKDVGKILTFPFHKRRKDPTEKFATEEVAIANSMGGGGIAGSVEAGDNPPVNKKKKKGEPTIIARGCMPGARGRFKGGVELLASFKKNKYT